MDLETICGDCGQSLEGGALGDLCPRCLFGSVMIGSEILEPSEDGSDATDIDIPNTLILGRLGRGAMATVFRARQTLLQRDVAVKVIAPRFSKDPEFIERLFREAQTMALLDHPGIARLYEIGETDGGDLYLIMELVEGESIQSRLASGDIPPKQAIRWTMQVCEALSYAHRKGVIHRDIKPSNLLIDPEQNVKLVDFGISRLAEHDLVRESLTATSNSLGTPEYIAPEQLDESEPQDHRVDLYALGVTFYQMLTGVMPRGVWYFPSKVVEGVDPQYDRVIERVLQNDPAKRYQSAGELEVDLRKLLVKPTRVAGWIFAGLGLTLTAYLGGFYTPSSLDVAPSPLRAPAASVGDAPPACLACSDEAFSKGWLFLVKSRGGGESYPVEVESIDDLQVYPIQIGPYDRRPIESNDTGSSEVPAVIERLLRDRLTQ